jgi:hypothetical protein
MTNNTIGLKIMVSPKLINVVSDDQAKDIVDKLFQSALMHYHNSDEKALSSVLLDMSEVGVGKVYVTFDFAKKPVWIWINTTEEAKTMFTGGAR